jgi:hypothetical protein
MTELPSPDDLAEAERWLRQYFDQGDEFTHRAGLVMAEYDRRGAEIARLEADNAKYVADFLTIGAVIGEQRAIVEAATSLVEEWEAIRNPADKLVWTIAEQLTERLATAVRKETP